MSGVITLTTDFGHKGPFAAVMRGVILQRNPMATVVDLAHDIPPQWPPEAGFWLRRSYKYFPNGTIHMAIVDPGVGTERDILVVDCDNHVFLAPDNGLLAELLEVQSGAIVRRLDLGRLEALRLPIASATFHGRDIFAPVAAELAAGRINTADLGPCVQDWIPGWLDAPTISNDRISGAIVTIDAFGNLISNIDADLLRPMHTPVVHVAGHELEMLPTYGRAQPGEILALINSFSVIEIAKSEGDASDGLGLERGAPIYVTDGHAT